MLIKSISKNLLISLFKNQYKLSCVSFRKEFSSQIEGLKEGESFDQLDKQAKAQQFWKEYDIKVIGKDAPLPVFDFRECEWPEPVYRRLEEDGFEKPTPIQSQGWPIVLSGRDMVGVAQTGSGKTLCYVLPSFVNIIKRGPVLGPQCLVLSPTRELAQQIQSVVRHFRITHSVCLYGGVSRVPQMRSIREINPQIIIATPGRINDFLQSSILDLKTVDYLVLDEADRMLDMGFEPQIRTIIKRIPKERQTLMWSATWPREVQSLAGEFMKDYIQINVGGTLLAANKNIKQIVEVVEIYKKYDKLTEILKQYPQTKQGENKILIFVQTKRMADALTHKLKLCGKSVMALHGDKSQNQRDFIMNEFRCGHTNILVATDVAARGLDVDDIQCVINFDYPQTAEDYVHRIGRTGRCNNQGTAYTLFTVEDKVFANDLIDVLKNGNQEINPKLLEISKLTHGKKMPRVWGYERRPGEGPFKTKLRQPKTFSNGRGYYYNENDFEDEKKKIKDKLWEDNYSVRRPVRTKDFID